jgi:hypothetical protein
LGVNQIAIAGRIKMQSDFVGTSCRTADSRTIGVAQVGESVEIKRATTMLGEGDLGEGNRAIAANPLLQMPGTCCLELTTLRSVSSDRS